MFDQNPSYVGMSICWDLLCCMMDLLCETCYVSYLYSLLFTPRVKSLHHALCGTVPKTDSVCVLISCSMITWLSLPDLFWQLLICTFCVFCVFQLSVVPICMCILCVLCISMVCIYCVLQILPKLIPCIIITPLDCFWEGSKLLGPDIPVFVP